jgi:hypothetical protein
MSFPRPDVESTYPRRSNSISIPTQVKILGRELAGISAEITRDFQRRPETLLVLGFPACS